MKKRNNAVKYFFINKRQKEARLTMEAQVDAVYDKVDVTLMSACYGLSHTQLCKKLHEIRSDLKAIQTTKRKLFNAAQIKKATEA